MDNSLPMLLPKGIVTNTTYVYQEVASYRVVPTDKVHQYWHVYTTTNKRLQDPTAHRLENFWWHVWGSDRRKLSGRTLAKIFEDISIGPTIAPLRGPPNRWEGPDVPPLTMQIILSHLRRAADENAYTSPSSSHMAANAPTNDLIRSPPLKSALPHPILKKARGPSASATKPTARFVTPTGSADKDEESDFSSSGSTVATSKNTPAFHGSREISGLPSPSQRNIMPILAQKQPILQRGTSSPSFWPHTTEAERHRSSGSSGATATFSVDQQLCQGKKTAISPYVSNTGDVSAHSQSPHGLDEQLSQRFPVSSNGVSNIESLAAKEPKTMQDMPTKRLSHHRINKDQHLSMHRSKSYTSLEETLVLPIAKSPSHTLFTAASTSATKTVAHGTFIEESGSNRFPNATAALDGSPNIPSNPEGDLKENTSRASFFTPTRPTSSIGVPLGRTRSQLTLLLERGKERSHD